MEQALTDQSPIGEIEELSGNVKITHANGVVEQAEEGMPVFEGDIIETDGSGAVNVYFADESNISLSENAHFSVDEFNYDEQSGGGESDFSMIRGLFVYTSGVIGREDPDDVTIDTPIGSIGIRGTIIAGDINENGQDADITVMEGAIVVRNDTGEVTLSNPFETVSLSGRNVPISDIRQISPEDFTVRFSSMHNVNSRVFSSIENDPAQDQATEEQSGDVLPGEESVEDSADDTVDDNTEDTLDDGSEDGTEDGSGDSGDEVSPDDGPEDASGSDDDAPTSDGEPAPEASADEAPAASLSPLALDSSGSLDLRPAANIVEAIKPALAEQPATTTPEPVVEAATIKPEPLVNDVPNDTTVNSDGDTNTGEASTPPPPPADPLILVHTGALTGVTIDENSASSLLSVIGQPTSASNYDDITFTLVDNHDGFFDLIDMGNYAKLVYTGATDANGNGLNYEHIDAYDIDIIAQAGTQTVTHSFDVTVNDVEEAPFFHWDNTVGSVDTMEFTTVASNPNRYFEYDLRSAFGDEDIGDTLTFTLEGGGTTVGTHSSPATITGSQLKIVVDGCENDFSFDIVATDAEGHTTTGTFDLTVLRSNVTLGNNGNNFFDSSSDGQIYTGYAGNDDIDIYNRNVVVFGNTGNDIIEFDSNVSQRAASSRAYGNAGDDTFVFHATMGDSNIAFGGVGNDQFDLSGFLAGVYRNFGAHGGGGDDLFILNESAMNSLSFNPHTHITGGIGRDTLQFSGDFANDINLANMIRNLEGIETLDLSTATSGVSLIINEDVMDKVLGQDGDVYINGDSGDSVTITGLNGTLVDTSGGYDHYQSLDGHGDLYIDSDINVIVA